MLTYELLENGSVCGTFGFKGTELMLDALPLVDPWALAWARKLIRVTSLVNEAYYVRDGIRWGIRQIPAKPGDSFTVPLGDEAQSECATPAPPEPQPTPTPTIPAGPLEATPENAALFLRLLRAKEKGKDAPADVLAALGVA